MEEQKASDLRRDGRLARVLSLDRDLTATMKILFSLSSRESGAFNSNPTAMDDRGRTPRSRSDRAAIAARSSRDRGEDGTGSERNRPPLIGKRSTKLEQLD